MGGDNLAKEEFKIECEIFKVDEMKQIVFGKALVPDKEDSQGDIVSKEDVEEAAHGFLINMQKQIYDSPSTIGYSHKIFEDIGFVVESYIDKDGSWVLGTKITNEDVWKGVLSGEITGYSIGGKGTRIPIK